MQRHRSKTQLSVEALEPRYLAGTVYQPTGIEQLFLELLNAARANPAVYGQSINLDLSGVAASQPLAFNLKLMQSSRLHSQDMNRRNFFAHTNPDGKDPGYRIDAALYDWQAYGESIAAGYDTPADALKALIIDDGVTDLGHRNHLLAIDSVSATLPEVGVGILQDGSGFYHDYYTIDSARDYFVSDTHNSFLTGVIYNDIDGDNFYSPGEGYGGVTVHATGDGADVTVTSFCSGGYSVPLPAGSYTVTVSSDGWSGSQSVADVAIGSSNVKLDFHSTEAGAGLGCANVPDVAELGVWSGTWQIDLNGNNTWDGTLGGDLLARFGSARTDVPLAMDWSGDGTDELAVMRQGKTLIIDSNGNRRLESSRFDTQIKLGNGGDQAVIGNWSGSGHDDIGVLRNEDGKFHLDTNGDRRLDSSDVRFAFLPQQKGDIAIVGDWDGNGHDEVGIFRGGSTFMLDSNGNQAWDGPLVDTELTVILRGAKPAPADYNGDGRTEIAVFTNDTYQIDMDHDGSLETILPFHAGSRPVPGHWA